MAAVVIDASIASAWCFPDEQTDYTRAVFQAVSSSAVDTVAPRLWAYEIRNSVRMGIGRGRISKPDSEQFLVSLNELNVRLSEPVLPRSDAWPDRLRCRLPGPRYSGTPAAGQLGPARSSAGSSWC